MLFGDVRANSITRCLVRIFRNTYRIGSIYTPGLSFSKRVFYLILSHKKRVKIAFQHDFLEGGDLFKSGVQIKPIRYLFSSYNKFLNCMNMHFKVVESSWRPKGVFCFIECTRISPTLMYRNLLLKCHFCFHFE